MKLNDDKTRSFELPFVLQKPLHTGKEKHVSLEASCIDYLRSLDPSMVVSLLTN